MTKMEKLKDDLSILLSGEAGQGIQTLERLLMRMFKISGRFVFSYSEFMSRIRGGNNSTEIRVLAKRACAFVDRVDIFIPFGPGSMDRFEDRITADTVILGDHAFIDEKYRGGNYNVIEIPFFELGKEIGGKTYLNLLVMGLFAGLFRIDRDTVIKQVKSYFSSSADDLVQKNINAVIRGIEKGRDILQAGNSFFIPEPSAEASGEILINGAESIAMGGLAGGCNFVSSYPMSPSTDVLVNFAKYSNDFDIIVEQAEDEISAINMAIASWYAGGRAMVTTSGGGYALMVEGVSLAGAVESPVVIHIGQRPGPATGLPTRTEQADLLFVLFSGHGEFPKVIFAPGNFTQGFNLARRSFYIADKYQIPAIILTDQFFLDSNCTVPGLDIHVTMSENIIVETDDRYKRYAFTGAGISPRGVPGFGTGIVCLDSDEHDEGGYITENFSVRINQVNKRMKKLEVMDPEILTPDLYGPEDYKYLVVSWGSTLNPVREAIEASGLKDLSLLHYSQVYPLHRDTEKYLKRAELAVIVENNYSSQFAMLIRMQTGFEFHEKVLKYNGMPFSVEELIDAFKKIF